MLWTVTHDGIQALYDKQLDQIWMHSTEIQTIILSFSKTKFLLKIVQNRRLRKVLIKMLRAGIKEVGDGS